MVSIRYNKTLWIALFLSLFFSFSFIFSDVLFERNDLGYKALSILNQFFVTIFMSLVIYWIVVRTRDTDNQVVQLSGILNFISIVIKSFDTEGKNEKLVKLEELKANLELGRKRIKRFSILGIALISLLLVNGLLNCFNGYSKIDGYKTLDPLCPSTSCIYASAKFYENKSLWGEVMLLLLTKLNLKRNIVLISLA